MIVKCKCDKCGKQYDSTSLEIIETDSFNGAVCTYCLVKETPTIERLEVRVFRYTIEGLNLARHIYKIYEHYNGSEDFTLIGITNDFDTVVAITQPYRSIHMKIDYYIIEANKKTFDYILNSLKVIAEPHSLKFTYTEELIK